MNWYKLSQSQVQNKPSYLDIGHGRTDDIDKSQVWALIDGKIEMYPAIGKNGKSGHAAYWQGDDFSYDFSYCGRFEPKTKNLSISCPDKHGTVPSAIMKKLYNTFGTDINVYQYGLYATSQPQKVVLAQNFDDGDSIEWNFPEADHDYDPNWDYELSSPPSKDITETIEVIMNAMNNVVIPEIGMGKAKLAYVKLDTDELANYIHGTAPHPVFVIDIESIQKGLEEYGGDLIHQIKMTLFHELGHAIEDWMNLEYDEHNAEEFAYQYVNHGIIENFWEDNSLEKTAERSYLDIGHGQLGGMDQNQLWIIDNGQIDIRPAITEDDERMTHDDYWAEDQLSNSYTGRFEPDTKRVSVISPKQGNIPSYIMRILYDTFGSDIKIMQYDWGGVVMAQSQKPSYTNIGHRSYDKSDQMWVITDGKLEIESSYNPNEVFDTHFDHWSADVLDRSYRGRFEQDTKRLSIMVPPAFQRAEVPSTIMRTLYDAFGTDIDVHIYGNGLILAQNLPLFDKTPEPKKKGLEVIPISCSHEGDLALTINGKRYDYVITYPYVAKDLLDELIYFSKKGWGKQVKRRIDWLDQYRVK